jgi:hypothetical protein
MASANVSEELLTKGPQENKYKILHLPAASSIVVSFVSISYSRICINPRHTGGSYEFTQIEGEAIRGAFESSCFAFGGRFGHTQIHISILNCALQHIENTGYCCGAALAIDPAVAAQ